MGGAPTPPSQDRTPQQIADDEAELIARRQQLKFNERERQRVDAQAKDVETKLAKEKALTEQRKSQEKSARSRNLRGFPSLLGGGGFTGFTLDSDAERRRRAGLTADEQKRLAAEEAERKRLAAEEAERRRLSAEEAERRRLAAAESRRLSEQAQQAQARARAAVQSEEVLGKFGVLRASKDPQVRAQAEVRTREVIGRFGGDIAEGQVTTRQLAEQAQKTELIAGGFDPKDPTKSLAGKKLTPLQVEKRKKAVSFRGVNPPSQFDEFDPSKSLARITPKLTSRQLEAERQKVALVAGGFDPKDPTKTLTGKKLTPLQVEKRKKAVAFRGVNPPGRSLVSITPKLTSRQREEKRVRDALAAAEEKARKAGRSLTRQQQIKITSFRGFNPPLDD